MIDGDAEFPPTTAAASPPRTPQRNHALGRTKSPVKLTPLERKERDRQRQRDQGKRRLQAIKDRDSQARALLSDQHKSSQWHRQERQEEELVLRRLERDLVDAQRAHPAAVGYRFTPGRDATDTLKATPVFQGYSPVLCPESQDFFLSGSARAATNKTPAAALSHPAFARHCIAKHNDAALLSPVFFLVRYTKTPLDEIDISDDDSANGGGSDDDVDEEDDEAMQTQEQFLTRQQSRDGSGARHLATITRLSQADQLGLQEALRGRFAANAGSRCLVCGGAAALGCPGCFEFSHSEYQAAKSAKATQRMKTPETHAQEREERDARYRGLRLKLMGYGRPSEEDVVEHDEHEEHEDAGGDRGRPQTTERRDYYASVLTDVHAIRKHRSVMNKYVTLHIKTLPVGNLISLRVDLRATVAYVYELYRSSTDAPNRKIHLLLPTTAGLFYLNELMEDATDTRCGLVNGEFLVEDFHLFGANNGYRQLHQQQQRAASPLAKRDPLRDAAANAAPPEFLLFSVAILSETNTPRLVANFLQQNFHFDDDDAVASSSASDVGGLRVETAIAKLPPHISYDAYQRRLVPHVHSMKEFARLSKQLERLEQDRERERLLWVAYQERKLARLEQKKRQRRLQQGGEGPRKRKVARAMAYLDFVLESTRNAQRARVWEERLAKLWQCAQRLEEWKLCKDGRLVDAENTHDTRQLVQRLLEAAMACFDRMLNRGAGAGPLLYPIQCIGSAASQRLVVKIGMRLGCSAAENLEYGLQLDLAQDFAAREVASAVVADADKLQRNTRGFTKKQLLALADEEAKRGEAAASWRCSDAEWKPRTSESQSSLLFTGSDLVHMPFLQFPWHAVVLAYKQVLVSLAFQLAQLDDFNALARVLQQEDAQLGRAEIGKWGDEVAAFQRGLLALAESGSPLLQGSALVRATQRVLEKKGVALLKKRLRQRRQKMREREAELERLRALQAANAAPHKSVVELLKEHFVREKAPKINAVLELTPAEKLQLQAERLLGAVAGKAAGVARAAKKEYAVRAL